MALFWALVFVVALAALIKGADMLLDEAKKIGEMIGLSPFAIGVVILGFGTSLPEMVSSIVAQLQGASDIVAGNVVGSNVANILLIVGLAALISRGTKLKMQDLSFDIAWVAISAGVLIFVAFDGAITTVESFFLLVAFFLYGTAIYATTQDNKRKVPKKGKLHHKDFFFLVLGFTLLIVGAHYTVESAIHIANIIGIGTGIIGLLAIAIGTSLPELFVTIKAAGDKHADIAIGNVFGSNVFNALLVVGVPGLLGSMVVDATTQVVGLSFMVLATGLLVWGGLRKHVSYPLGMVLLFLYGVFVLVVAGIV